MDAVDMDADDLFGADEAIEDNRYDGIGKSDTKADDDGDGPRKVKVRQVVRNPQLKLNADRLTSDKGIPKLLKSFDGVKFKGKGYESQDLDTLIKTIEHWSHCMFPKIAFADLIDKLENLGGKRPVQVCMKKIRQDMFCDDDIVDRPEDDDVAREGDFDSLFNGETHSSAVEQVTSDVPASGDDKPAVNSLTEEQLERIARNKKLAEERRLARLQRTDQETPAATTSNNDTSPNEDQKTEEELIDMLQEDMED